MKKIVFIFSILFFTKALIAQTPDSTQSISITRSETDSLPYMELNNGRLLHDDPAFNPKYPRWIPMVRVLSSNVFNWAVAKYVYKFDWPSSSIDDWKNNFKKGPHWDQDRFSLNFIGHPHSGSFYHNVARSNGYSFWASLPFTLQGSLTWEYLGENERPSYNDLINTPVSGLFLGEVFYRVSSNILDDRTRGGERVFREILAGIVNPTRAFNRFTQGKMFRVTSKEVYQKEPMDITFSAGIHKVNNKVAKDNRFATGGTNGMLNLQLDYGDPFEQRTRKPFDVFRYRMELSYGADSNLLDNVIGYGMLTGKTKSGRSFAGIFQHFDYWRNNIFELGSLGFGGGLLSRIPVGKRSNLNSSVHFAIVPLAGNSTEFGPDTSEFRKYNFGGGLQAKLEETLHLNDRVTLGITGYYYWIHTYNGIKGNSLVGILKPSVTLKLLKNMDIGLEHHIYRNDRFLNGIETLHLTRTEQKLFIKFGFKN